MKKGVLISTFFVLTIVVLSSCGVLGSKRTSESVSFTSSEGLFAFLEKGDWIFDLERVTGPTVPSSFNAYGYTVKVSEGQLTCHLPFFGRAYRADYAGKNPMDFTAPIEVYSTEPGRKDGVEVYIEAVNEQRNRVRFTCNVFPSGTMYIIMMSSDTESISYIGRLHKSLKK